MEKKKYIGKFKLTVEIILAGFAKADWVLSLTMASKVFTPSSLSRMPLTISSHWLFSLNFATNSSSLNFPLSSLKLGESQNLFLFLKPLQNKKDQKNLGYPKKKQSFSK